MSFNGAVEAIEHQPDAMISPRGEGISDFPASVVDVMQRGIDTLIDNPWALYSGVAIGGLVVGAVAEHYAQKSIAGRRQSLVSVHGEIAEVFAPSRFRRAVSQIFSLAGAGMTVVAVANTAAWTQTDSEEVVPAHIELVVDRSGATLIGEEPAYLTVNEIIGELAETNTDIDVLSASTGVVEQIELSDATSTMPFGDAPMQSAVDRAIDDIEQARHELTAGDEIPNSAVVVITNGNSIEVQQGIPTFVLNVSSDGKNTEILEDVALVSGGQYFDKDALDTNEEIKTVVDQITGSIEANAKKSDTVPKWPQRVFVGLGSLFAIARWSSTRSRLTTTFGLGKRRG